MEKQKSPEQIVEKAASRLLFIDIFRGFITLVMLQGHVTNSTFLPAIKATRGFHYLNLFNGMIAPSFIFIAGFSIALVLDRRWDSFAKLEKPLWIQLRRLLFILGVGYWLHLPSWSFQNFLKMSKESILYFFRCDVLHLIALSLMFIVLLAAVVKRPRIRHRTLVILSFFIIFATPFVYDIDPRNYLPVLIGDYINTMHGALFPIFPWAAYAFLGAALCWTFLQARRMGTERKLFLILFISGAIMFAGAFALFYVPWQYHTYADPSRSSPRHFMLKMGYIFLLLSTLWYLDQKSRPRTSVLGLVGQETLMVYGLHLVIVYGASFTPYYIARDIGPVLTVLPSLFVSLLLITSMTLAAVIWHWTRLNHPRLGKGVFYSLCAIYFLKFFAT